jgi:hypothetical protein
MAVDSTNNYYCGGWSGGTGFPVSNGAYQTTFGGGTGDAYLMKFDSTGARVWGTYYGGSGYEWGGGIAVDSSSNPIISGTTSSTGLATTGAFQTTVAGSYDAYVAKFTSAGARVWATYIGGSDQEYYSSGVACDRQNNICISGTTLSTNFPVTTGAYQSTNAGGYEEYVVKFNQNGGRIWATYLGGNSTEYGGSIAVDLDSNIIICGYTQSSNFPTTSGAFQTSIGGSYDGFITKFNAAGRVRWSTFYGGNSYDWLPSLAPDLHRNIIFGGYTSSSNFPITADAYQGTMSGQYDAVVVKLDSSGGQIWSTYIGGTQFEWINGMATDRNAVYATGSTTSTDFPVTSGAFQTSNAGNYDLFLAKFCDINVRITVTGPRTICPGDSIILDAGPGYEGYLWNNGTRSRTTTIKATGDYWVVGSIGACSGVSDTIHVSVYPYAPVHITNRGSAAFCAGDSTVLDIPNIYPTIRWSNGATTARIVVRDSGVYYVNVVDTNGCRQISDTVRITVYPKPNPVITVRGSKSLCAGDSVELDAGPGYAQYLWSNFATSQKITVKTAGTYSVRVTTGNQCTGTSAPVTIKVNPRPDSTIMSLTPTVICEGDTCILSGKPGYRYNWSTGDTTQVIKVARAGTLTLTVTDTNGCSATGNARIQVEPRPYQAISPLGPTTFCQGDSVILDAGSGYRNYLWSTGEKVQRIVVRTSGRYWVSFESMIGCAGSSDTVTITVRPRPSATISGPVSVCPNGTASYAATTAPGLQYLWSVSGGGGSLQGSNVSPDITVSWGASGQGKVHLRVVDSTSGCFAESEIDVAVGGGVKPAIVGNRSPRLCAGDSIELDAGPGYATYLWSTGATSRKITVSTVGVYTVKVSVAGGCSGTSDAYTVSRNPDPTPVITALGPTTFCPGGTVELDAGGGYSSYSWSNGGNGRTITVGTAGSYSVTVRDSVGCTGTSSPVAVSISDPPKPVIGGPNALCLNSTADYLAVPAVAGDTYLWSVTGGTIVSGQNRPTVTVNWTTSGTVNLTQTSAATGCTGSAEPYGVTISSRLSPKITTPEGRSFCQGDSLLLTAPVGYTSYLWSTGATTNQIYVSKAGTYTLTVTFSSGCSGSDSVTVVEKQLPFPFILPQGPIGICPGDSATLSAAEGYRSYRWSSGQTTRQIVVRTPGDYRVTAENEDGCRGQSEVVTVVLNPAPAVPTISLSGDTLISSPAASYQWYYLGEPIPGATGQRFVATEPGSYSVRISEGTGCSAESAPIDALEATATVALGIYDAAPGDHLRVPIELRSSHGLDNTGSYRYRTTVRFNKSLLYPSGTTPIGRVDGSQREVVVEGTRGAGVGSGSIGELEFTVALGDTLATALEIREFVWQEGKTNVQKIDGLVRVHPTGGWSLFVSKGRLSLLPVVPNPVTGTGEIIYETIEPGRTHLYIADPTGSRVYTLVDAETQPERRSIQFDATQLPSGNYFLVLQTPSGSLLQPMQVEH